MRNEFTSTPLALKAAWAFWVALGIAGNTTPRLPTTSWAAAEPRYSTHLIAAGLFLELTHTASARPLYMLDRLPLGPIGVGARPTSTPLYPNIWPIIHEPLVIIAYLPAPKMSPEFAPVTDCTLGM